MSGNGSLELVGAAVVSNRDQLLHVSRQVAEGMLRVAQQERRLVELERSGYDTTNAQAALAAFKQTLQQMIERRKETLLSLAEADRLRLLNR